MDVTLVRLAILVSSFLEGSVQSLASRLSNLRLIASLFFFEDRAGYKESVESNGC